VRVIETGWTGYTHTYDSDFALSWCSEAVDMLHHEEGQPSLLTGLGFCPHTDEVVAL
jgi:hypothetical protein